MLDRTIMFSTDLNNALSTLLILSVLLSDKEQSDVQYLN